MDELDIFIGGQWRRGGGNLMHSQFPADGAINAALHAASLDDLQEAIDCADRAWREPTWRAMLPHQRAKILHKVADLSLMSSPKSRAAIMVNRWRKREGW